MKNKLAKPTIACEWMKTTPVMGEQSLVETEEQLTLP